MTCKLPEKMQRADKLFDEKSLWWQVKRLSLLVTVDEESFATNIREKLAKIEKEFEQKAEEVEQNAKNLILEGKQDLAKEKLFSLTDESVERLYNFAKTESKRLSNVIKDKGGLYGRQKEAIERYCEYAQIPILDI